MTQFSPELPPSPSQCRYCNRPLGMVHYRVNGQPVCDPCSRRVVQMLELNEFRGGPYTMGLLYGLAAAILCGFGWAVIVKITHAEIGIIAGDRICHVPGDSHRQQWATRQVDPGDGGDPVAGGCVHWQGLHRGAWVCAWDHLSGDLHMQGNSLIPRAIVFLLAFLTFQFFGLIWYGIAAYQAWRMTQPVRLNIEGRSAAGTAYLFWQVARRRRTQADVAAIAGGAPALAAVDSAARRF